MIEGLCWTYLDPKLRSTRAHITQDDTCYYYLIKDDRGWDDGPHAEANQYIINFKHDPEKFEANSAPIRYKQKAIITLAKCVVTFFDAQEDALAHKRVYIVPIPTSKPRSSQGYDIRLDALCEIVEKSVPWVSYLPLLDAKRDIGKSHKQAGSRNPIVLAQNMACGEIPSSDVERYVVLVDDVLTTGAHYAACKQVIQSKFPDVVIIGLFLSVHVNKGRGEPFDWQWRS